MKRNTVAVIILLFTIIFFNNMVVYCEDMQITKKIVIDIPSRTLSLYENNEIIKQYPVALGKSYSQTPTGNYYVINKVVNPYYRRGKIPGGSPENPLGTRWIGFKYNYGIHGNSNPASIGTFASAGCVRMYERDVQELYDHVAELTPVIIQYELIKIANDIKGENPILIVYPDYYSKENKLIDNVIKKLREIEIYDKIEVEKLNKLNSFLNKQKVIYSKGWTFFINDRYITGDIINDNDSFYINKKSLEQFFNIRILSLAYEDKCYFLDYVIPEKEFGGEKYISLDSLKMILGGNANVNHNMETVQYNIKYVLLNNSLISGEAENLTEEPIIPLLSIANLLNIKIHIVDGNIKLSLNGEEIQYVEKNRKPYLPVQTLKQKLQVRDLVDTLYAHIKLYKDPDIIFEDKICRGKFVNDEIYVPYDIVINELCPFTTADITTNLNKVDKMEVSYIQNRKYVNLKDLDKYVAVTKNLYNTEIRLKRRNMY